MTKAKCQACGEPLPRHALLYRLPAGEGETTNTLLCPSNEAWYQVDRHDGEWTAREVHP